MPLPMREVLIVRLRHESLIVHVPATSKEEAETEAQRRYEAGDYDDDSHNWDCGDVLDQDKGDPVRAPSPEFIGEPFEEHDADPGQDDGDHASALASVYGLDEVGHVWGGEDDGHEG